MFPVFLSSSKLYITLSQYFGMARLRFWIGYTTFLISNFVTSGLPNLRDGFLVDFFSTHRKVSGLFYGLVQASYGIGMGAALIVSVMSTKLKTSTNRSIKSNFLCSVLVIITLNILIGAGQFLKNKQLFVALDFTWRFLLGAVSFINQVLLTKMTDLWFDEKRDLFLGVVFTSRFVGSATMQYTGSLLYVKYGYFFTFLIHGASMIPVLIPAFIFISDPKENYLPTGTSPEEDQKSAEEAKEG